VCCLSCCAHASLILRRLMPDKIWNAFTHVHEHSKNALRGFNFQGAVLFGTLFVAHLVRRRMETVSSQGAKENEQCFSNYRKPRL